tara:strand:- start:4904 stop:5368 length:465 start_codon:yes stop_codon:yes gene_type:complete
MKKLIAILLTLVLTGCGFKVVQNSSFNNFSISDIITEGDKRINYILKNKLLSASNESENKLIQISLKTNKDKQVKERNIKNEITKYQIQITIKVTCSEVSNGSEFEFSKSKTGDYSVSNQYSRTLGNEKKLVELLTDNIADQILNELKTKLNAL